MSQYRRGQSGRQQYGRPSWLMAQLRRRPKPLWMVLVAHVLALGIALVLYALPHHVIPRAGVAVGLSSSRSGMTASATPVPAAETVETVVADTSAYTTEVEDAGAIADEAADTPAADAANAANADGNADLAGEPTAAPAAEPEPVASDNAAVGDFRAKFADKFTTGEVERTDTTYRSQNLNINIWSEYDEALQTRYYVADFYIADISCLTTVFAKDQYGNGYAEWPKDAARRYQGILTLNGDYYGSRPGGVVIRNGTLYRDEKNMMDLCIIYWDGTMKTFDPFNFSAETEINNGAYQGWCFGPGLLDDEGHAKESYNSTVRKANPRSVIGYFEPGHYCFVAVDGRSKDSVGLTMVELGQLMEKLGCRQAYNLDGGDSSMLLAGTSYINSPNDGGRKVSDFIMVVDAVTNH